jgi:hypothetical protein
MRDGAPEYAHLVVDLNARMLPVAGIDQTVMTRRQAVHAVHAISRLGPNYRIIDHVGLPSMKSGAVELAQVQFHPRGEAFILFSGAFVFFPGRRFVELPICIPIFECSCRPPESSRQNRSSRRAARR